MYTVDVINLVFDAMAKADLKIARVLSAVGSFDLWSYTRAKVELER
jgi:hypothetical protein